MHSLIRQFGGEEWGTSVKMELGDTKGERERERGGGEREGEREREMEICYI